MIISTPEELRAFMPSHVLDNLETMQGFLDNSENDFLAERIGEPLLSELNDVYHDESRSYIEALETPYAQLNYWHKLLRLCQRCIVFDAFARAADIHAVSVNGGGINIASAQGYDVAPEKTMQAYKTQCVKESHAASNRLLIQLERWQQQAPKEGDGQEEDQERQRIVELWKKSAYYYYVDGLLFNTATEFGLYVNIYESREKFIQLLPDIRYCQETHLAAELGDALLEYLIERRREGKLSDVEKKAYQRLQRAVSLKVEARAPMFKRAEAKDEAEGQMRLALDFVRRNQCSLPIDVMKASPLFDATLWRSVTDGDATHEHHEECSAHCAEDTTRTAHRPADIFGHRHRHYVDEQYNNSASCGRDGMTGDGMLISSII